MRPSRSFSRSAPTCGLRVRLNSNVRRHARPASSVVNAQGPSLKLAAGALLWCGVALASDSRFGELPNGSVGTAETHGVLAEICREHVFDPKAASTTLPQGYRFTLVSEVASKSRSLESLLQSNPRVRNFALGVLCFVSADRLVIEGSPIQIISPARGAFWWAAVSGPRHADMRGKVQWVQLASWHPSGTQNRSAVLKADPMAEFVDLEVKQAGPNNWNLRLALPNEVVAAEVRSFRSSDAQTPSAASPPSYMSVPLSGQSAGYFTVYTYFGHVHRFAQGSWRATGTGVFSDALALAGESEAFDTVFQEGWASRSGLYPFSPK